VARFPGARWRPIATKQRYAMPKPVRINFHVAVSNADSLWGFFNTGGNPDSHLYTLRNGSAEQYVDTSQIAYCDLQGNPDTISVESQGGVTNAQGEEWTPAQCETHAQIIAWAHREHGIPLRLATDSRPGPSSHGVSWHRLGIDGNFPGGLLKGRVTGGLKYSNSRGKVCPGNAKIRQIPGILARAQQIITPTPERTWFDMATENDLRKVIRAELADLFNQRVKLTGSSKEAFGPDFRAAALLGYAAQGGLTAHGPTVQAVGKLVGKSTDEILAAIAEANADVELPEDDDGDVEHL